MFHRVIQGRIYRTVTIEAADTKAASHHISAERPISGNEQLAFLRRIGQER